MFVFVYVLMIDYCEEYHKSLDGIKQSSLRSESFSLILKCVGIYARLYSSFYCCFNALGLRDDTSLKSLKVFDLCLSL